jgi:heme exporter protein CcmD
MSHDPHFGFVVAAYALAFVIAAGMIVTILVDYMRLKQALSALSRGTGQNPDIGRGDLNRRTPDRESFE